MGEQEGVKQRVLASHWNIVGIKQTFYWKKNDKHYTRQIKSQ